MLLPPLHFAAPQFDFDIVAAAKLPPAGAVLLRGFAVGSFALPVVLLFASLAALLKILLVALQAVLLLALQGILLVVLQAVLLLALQGILLAVPLALLLLAL